MRVLRRRRTFPAVFLAVVALLVSVLAGGCSHEVDVPPPTPTRDATGARATAAQEALAALQAAVADGSRAQAVALAAEPSRDLLGEIWDNARNLRLDHISLRYVDEAGALDDRERSAYGRDAWRATVDMTYAYSHVDTDPARIETEAVFVPEGSDVRIAAFGSPAGSPGTGEGAGVRTPLWLLGRLAVVRTPRTLVLVSGDSAGRYPTLASRAIADVARVLPSWHGTLVLEVPEDRSTLDELVQASPGQYDHIAAVTTTADGTVAHGAPVRVFVNPGVLAGLKPRGAQVVVSHEATHVAAGAPFSSMPTWLLEGFADYVALDHADVPVSVAAGQILKRIRTKGLPHGLPSASDLDPTANGLGATYEEAWLACRFLGQEYGTARLVAFYRAVDAGGATQEAFRSVLGTTQQRFVAGWRRDLARLAGVTG